MARSDFGVTTELFASPLNSRFVRHCSAAADVDAAFGSVGSFFTADVRSGACLANPPFDPSTVAAMAARMEQLLCIADRDALALTFVVILPAWTEQACWQELRASPHRSCTVTLPKSKHSYIDGGQHYGRRGTSAALRLSVHDSSAIFLQSAVAAAQSPVTPSKQARLAVAFRAGLGPTGQPDPHWVPPAPRC